MNAGEICPTGQCCSAAGYCGTTEVYCASPDCLEGYGTCDADSIPSGASTASIARPHIGDIPYGVEIDDCVQPAQIACTFDDGPYLYTNDLLDLLDTYGVKCTFFITGNNNGKGAIDITAPYPTVIQRMITDGHQVASHTWGHLNLSSLTVSGIQNEMIYNEMALRNIIGKIPTYMRPPFSECNDDCYSVMNTLGYHTIYFDLDTQDYLNDATTLIQNSKDIVHAALSSVPAATNDFLAISHDIHYQTVYNFTSYFLDQMNTYGFKAVPVGVCLNDPEANWYRSAT
jgi:peptidoglycan/xylan/chitin deacetylase (PgdA/CDA1 family)